jgi:hypothetical protein
MKFLTLIGLWVLLYPMQAKAACNGADKLCIMEEIKTNAAAIENKNWRDTTYRELAKSYTYEGYEDKAIALISIIERPDTKAMTIRGIGFTAADNKWEDRVRYDALFKKLALEAEKITHLPSHAIAYTYIAMAQAFAEDDAGAFKTAKAMKNEALRNKAFGESAEIQAERRNYDAAMESIAQINSLAFRNKAYATIAKILTKADELEKAYQAASKIENAYAKAQAFQTIVNHGNAEETLKN